MKPAVSCVIPHFEQHDRLGRCLAALAAQQEAPPFEVLVVDDGSRMPPPSTFPGLDLRVLRAKHRGPAAARNLGANEAQAPVVAFTDSDCLPRPEWMARVARAFDVEKPPAAVVGPLVDATIPAAGVGPRALLHRFMQTISVLDLEPIEIQCDDAEFLGTIGANFAVDRRWFDSVDGFDETFGQPGGEDYDLGLRLQSAGGAVQFERRAVVEHHYPTDRRALVRRWIHYGVGKSQFAAKHGIAPNAIHIVCDRRRHLVTRLPAIMRAARRHFPASVATDFTLRKVRYFVEWLFQVGAVRAGQGSRGRSRLDRATAARREA